ncbi:SGNH/GDSL hydrolase family protein [bacterium]|nr:SGNH/GDSL hydrolase family protein [bacterium]
MNGGARRLAAPLGSSAAVLLFAFAAGLARRFLFAPADDESAFVFIDRIAGALLVCLAAGIFERFVITKDAPIPGGPTALFVPLFLVAAQDPPPIVAAIFGAWTATALVVRWFDIRRDPEGGRRAGIAVWASILVAFAVLSFAFVDNDDPVRAWRSRAGIFVAVMPAVAAYALFRRRHSIAWPQAVLLLAVIASIVSFEAGLRIDGYFSELRHVMPANDGEGGAIIFGNPIPAGVLKLQPGGWHVRLGLSHRWREQVPSIVKGRNVFRIVALGSSSTKGDGIDREQDTWPWILQERLRGRGSGRTIEVLNAGQSAATSFHMLMNLEHEIVRYKPDLVIVYAGYNDTAYGSELSARRLFEIAAKLGPDISAEDYRRVIADEMARSSERGKAIRRMGIWLNEFSTYRLMARFVTGMRNTMMPAPSVAVLDHLPQSVSETEFGENLGEMAAIARAHGFAIVFAAEASVPGLPRYQSVMRRVANETGTPFLDARSGVGRCGKLFDELFLDDVHLTAAGHACLAEILDCFLVEHGLVADAGVIARREAVLP